MAVKVVYEVTLEEVWKSNIKRGKFPTENTYNVISNRGAQFAVTKAKAYALKRREKGVQGVEDKPYDDSCVEVQLKSVHPSVTVDC